MISLSVKWIKDEQGRRFPALGFMGQGSKTFIPVESCAIADERINGAFAAVGKQLEDQPAKKRYRISQTVLRLGDQGPVMTGFAPKGEQGLVCRILGKQLTFPFSGFFQHNFSVLDSLVQAVKRFLQPSGPETLIDLYCGVGLFSLTLGDAYSRVYGIEEGFEAVKFAVLNAKQNKVTHASFLEGRVEHLLHEFASMDSETAFHAIVDPPREGLKPEVIRALKLIRPERLVYVSCEPSALGRDLSLLETDFRIEKVQPIDLFPQTKHIETVVLLTSRDLV